MRWLPVAEQESTVAYIRLTTASRQGAEAFWSEVLAGIAAAGIPLPMSVDAGGFLAVREAVLDLDAPLLLVIDDYHHSGDGGKGRCVVAEQLVDLLQEATHLQLIAAARWQTSLSVIGSLSLDTAELTSRHLALTPERARILAERKGLAVDDGAIERVVHEVGGWPVAVRASIEAAALGDGVVEVREDTLHNIVALVHDELEDPLTRDFAFRAAVPEEVSEAAACVLIEADVGPTLLRRFAEAGVMSRRRTGSGLSYSFPPAVRRALLELLRERSPEIVLDVHRRLIAVAARVEGPIGVLRHACLAEEWPTALKVIEDHWATLVTMHRSELAALAATFPADIAETNPRVAVARRDFRFLPTERRPGLQRWSAKDAGYFQTASELLEQADDNDAHLLMQWGVGSILSADNEAAAYAFGRVLELGMRRQDAAVRRVAMAGLIASSAVAGEVTEAMRLAQSVELSEVMSIDRLASADDPVQASALVAARVFTAFAAVDAMAPDAADWLKGMLEPERRDDIWAMAVHTRGQHAVVAGDTEVIGRNVVAVRAAMRHLDPAGVTQATLATGLAELLLQLEMPAAAMDALDAMPDSHVTAPTRAFVRLVMADLRGAVELADRALRDPLWTIRGRLTSNLTRACALLRLGRREDARRAFADAAGVARLSGQRRFFALLPRDVVAELADDPGVVAELYRGPAAVGSPLPHLDRPVMIRDLEPGLSEREIDLLDALDRHMGPTGVSAELGLSVNTVKTHLQRIYRRLGVRSRDEALCRYAELRSHHGMRG